MIVPMAKIRIVGPKSKAQELTEHLQALGMIHIESSPELPEADHLDRVVLNREQDDLKREMEGFSKALKEILNVLPRNPKRGGRKARDISQTDTGFPFHEEIQGLLDRLKPQLEEITRRMRDLEAERDVLDKYERVLVALEPLLEQLRGSRELAFLGLVIEKGDPSTLPAIRHALSEITGNRFELFLSDADPERLAGLLVIPEGLTQRIHSILRGENISELRLPETLSDLPIHRALKILLRRRFEIPGELQRLQERLMDLSGRWRDVAERLETILENRLAQLASTQYFFQTHSAVFIYGWLPEAEWSFFVSRFREKFSETVWIEQVPIIRKEFHRIPVSLKNPGFIRAFEYLTRLVSLPRYGSIDPTPFIGFFFPLFFGLILGDLGYGLIFLGVSVFARFRWRSVPWVEEGCHILMYGSISTMMFGVLYGEFFGDFGERFGLHPILVNRMEGFVFLFKLTLGIGLVHLLLGMGMGIYTGLRQNEGHEVLKKIGGLAGFLSFLVWAGSFTEILPGSWKYPAGVVFIGSVWFILRRGGSMGLMEFHNVVNFLSYLRLMGIGIASAALAFAANTIGELAGGMIIGAVIGLLFHVMNMIFGFVSPTIQALRLHYVEFFENFFQPGGREFRPFKML